MSILFESYFSSRKIPTNDLTIIKNVYCYWVFFSSGHSFKQIKCSYFSCLLLILHMHSTQKIIHQKLAQYQGFCILNNNSRQQISVLPFKKNYLAIYKNETFSRNWGMKEITIILLMSNMYMMCHKCTLLNQYQVK